MNGKRHWVSSGMALALIVHGVIAEAAEPLKANVIHWWTSGGESAAIRQFADAYNQAGGQWIDNAVAGADQARATAINRIVAAIRPLPRSSIRRSSFTN